VVAAVGEMGARASALQLDTGDVSAFDAFVRSVRSALASLGAERFDYSVNNAGTSHHNPFDRTTEGELDRLYEVHFKGVFFLTQKLLPLINEGGRIINISSGLTRMTLPGSGAYASMKTDGSTPSGSKSRAAWASEMGGWQRKRAAQPCAAASSVRKAATASSGVAQEVTSRMAEASIPALLQT